jgi:DNA-binding CsgD family transcriptional regulator
METAAASTSDRPLSLEQGADGLLSIYEAGNHVGVHPATVAYWFTTGRISGHGRRARGDRIVALVSLRDVWAVADSDYLPSATRLEARRRREARLYRSGLGLEEVADRFGVSDDTVRADLLALGERLRPRGRAHRDQRAARSQGRLTTSQVAELAGCSTVTAARYAKAGTVSATRSGKVWLFEPSAVEQLQAAIAENQRLRDERLTYVKPRTGVVKKCPCGCGQDVYLKPCEADQPGYAPGHWGPYRGKHGIAFRPLFDTMDGPQRRKAKAHAAGRKGGRPRVGQEKKDGDKAQLVAEKRTEALRLHAAGRSERAIQLYTGLTRHAVRQILAEDATAMPEPPTLFNH